MLIIGCDYHPSFEQIAFCDTSTGECGNRRLEHGGEAEAFYRSLQGQAVRVGMEATGGTRWFERLLADCGIELWIGHPGKIRAAAPRKQKTDRRDAELLLDLLLQQRFPRLAVPSPEQRNLRQLVGHRHRLVQMQTKVKNQLQALAINEGLRLRRALWSRKGQAPLQALALPHWAEQKRCDLLALLADLQRRGAVLDQAVEAAAQASPVVRCLRQQSGVGSVVGLAYELTILDPTRFQTSRQVAKLFCPRLRRHHQLQQLRPAHRLNLAGDAAPLVGQHAVQIVNPGDRLTGKADENITFPQSCELGRRTLHRFEDQQPALRRKVVITRTGTPPSIAPSSVVRCTGRAAWHRG